MTLLLNSTYRQDLYIVLAIDESRFRALVEAFDIVLGQRGAAIRLRGHIGETVIIAGVQVPFEVYNLCAKGDRRRGTSAGTNVMSLYLK